MVRHVHVSKMIQKRKKLNFQKKKLKNSVRTQHRHLLLFSFFGAVFSWVDGKK